ncbi:hypothetical protein C7974DRAFT_411824 [Boeremia exigua]|uniref:uncharacterized protein n=1 Tax=Boeremia exigua TaxID=749465 RepID=UPI001E8CAD2C|nr:uncharacterized protein C7974DRAFT_411824 [Boeremia exigua]KAH6638401.1 hypothetical protein C7974DRAFT_411824 [Boeremia exigua]
MTTVRPFWLLVALLFLSVANCTPTEFNLKRQSSDIIVTGIDSTDQDGNSFLRLEVRDMQANYPDQWNLYLIGLDQMHVADQKEPLSYYGLAGIHGRPYTTQLDAPGLSHKTGSIGYCPHSMALFLGWHRPYLALFEQALYARIRQLAENAPADQIDRYRWAASSFRIPYWDWSQGDQSGEVPDFFMSETTVVDTPEGRKIEIWNPLYKYDFKPVPKGFEGKWTQINHTIRWPASDNPGEESRQHEFAASFAKLRRQIQDQTALAFRRDTLNGFWEAIEMVHGWVHGAIGGGYSTGFGGKGHMWPLEYSSYEPLFWLHHANVDRLFALYQAQHPDARLQPSNVGSAGNVFVEDNSEVDGDTPLLPFRRNPGSFWTTNEAMDWRMFGYDYADTRSASTASARATVSRLYSGNARERLTSEGVGKIGNLLTPDVADATYTNWVIETAAAPLDLPPTFIVQFSLVGDFSSDESTDVGMWSVLMPSDHNQAKRSLRKVQKLTSRAAAADMTLHGTLSLTNSLLDQIEAGKIQSLGALDVVPFLKERLSWKIYSSDGTQLPDSSMEAIRVQIASESARFPSDPNVPIEYSNDTVAYPEVTAGKMGGAS